MSIQTTEMMNRRFTRESMAQQAHSITKEKVGLIAAKFAVAGLVLDNNNNVLVCYHAARDGESEEGAAGAVTETLRYLKEDMNHTETPLEALMRCFKEEHKFGRSLLRDSGIYYAGSEPYSFGEWPVGMLNGTVSTYPSVNVILRATEPEIFTRNGRISEELIDRQFLPLEQAMIETPFRPGYREWLRNMQTNIDAIDPDEMTKIDWPTAYVETGRDARSPYLNHD